ncbi:MAG: glycosyl transferase family 1, partial [Bacteroidota bacterium]|nr:glycosyl transferase family 1 [Bacteroidota bacterium]
MNKVLIITYYWPPSGGAGVQRWLKLSKYLAIEGLDVHVLTVDERHASYMQMDESLLKEVS